MWNNWPHFVFRHKIEICQRWESLLHRRQNFLQLGDVNVQQLDSTDSVVALKCRDDVIHAPFFVVISRYDDRQGWPDVECLPHARFGCAVKSEIQPTR